MIGYVRMDSLKVNANDTENTVTLYFVDNTQEQWVKNDDAVIVLVDNTNGHVCYDMTKLNDSTWKAQVPESATNITFNRYDSGKTTQWNSWSAGGREDKNAYYADGSEYGHWESISEEEEENYFHAGDIIYLDLSEFTSWENDNAIMYANFSDATKEQNSGNNINASLWVDSGIYNPKITDYEVSEHVYAYIVTKQDQGKDVLRFWRGNDSALWNYSVTLDYEQYKSGYNCIKVNGWDSQGTFINSEYDIDCLADTDGDCVPNYVEAICGTDKLKTDTDGDGLSDYDEIVVTKTDPTLFDSVTEGVSDAEIDLDEDGLLNREEINLGTNPLSTDTDEDALTDYDEVNVYGTNPVKADTDEDSINDGDEIVLTLNPNKTDSDEDGVLDGDEYFEQTVNEGRIDDDLLEENCAIPSITVSAKGNVNSQIYVSEYDGYLKGEERSYVGKVVEIDNVDMNGGNITFSLADSYTEKNYTIGGEVTNGLLICYNDGETTVPLDTTYDAEKRTLSADISSNGIYFMMDVIDWIESLGIEYTINDSVESQSLVQTLALDDEADNDTSIANVQIKGQVDIVFIVDTTGSMSPYIMNVKNNLTSFVNDIEAAGITPNFALVEYRDITCDGQNSTNVKQTETATNWFKDADEFKAEITKLGASGGGDEPETLIDALEMARQLDLRTTSQKFFIVVTDASYKVDNNYGITDMDEMTGLLVEDDINVSVVSTTTWQSVYQLLYESTGGIFANVSGNFKDELLGIADVIKEETNNGYWIALKGLLSQIIRLDEKPTAGSTCDTDKDTLYDIDELKSVIPATYVPVESYVSKYGSSIKLEQNMIPVYDFSSNPVKEDSDDDGLLDGKHVYDKFVVDPDAKKNIVAPKDTQPLEKNGTKEIWEAHIDNASYTVIPNDYADENGWEISFDQKLADSLVQLLVQLDDFAMDNYEEIREKVLAIKSVFEGFTDAGAYILNFIYDNQYKAYHSQPDTWQREFGYNKFYDDVFKIGSYMNFGRAEFTSGGLKYALWMWKGDYWNLQSGAEIGLYTYNTTYSGIEQYDAIDYELPMTLYLYNYHSKDDIETVFNWEPKDEQWWITGFNPKFTEPVPEEMVVIGTIDFSSNKYVYNSFKNARCEYHKISENNIVFDDENYKVWVIWH